MNRTVYRRLADYLDTLPNGFAAAKDDADLDLLAVLFNEPQAALAPFLTLAPQPAEAIALRAGLPLAEAVALLEGMAARGTIMSSIEPGQPVRYHALPWVVGIYEMQVNNLTPELRRAMEHYWRNQVRRRAERTIPQMRVIPVEESIEARLEVLPYEQVDALVAAHTHFAVAPCICRRHARLEGGGCSAPEESCLVMGEWAEYYARTGRGRAIDRDEVRAILQRANDANLVLEPSNSQDIAFLCTCCGCCCGVLQGLKHQPRPADAVVNDFIAQLDAEACRGCFTCLQRCQMEALVEDDDRVLLKQERCIGCGLCVTTCPSGALALVRKPACSAEVPSDMLATWQTITRQRSAHIKGGMQP